MIIEDTAKANNVETDNKRVGSDSSTTDNGFENTYAWISTHSNQEWAEALIREGNDPAIAASTVAQRDQVLAALKGPEPEPTWEEPEDRSEAKLSDWGEVEYVSDIIRPGRIVTVAAEESTGKSFAFQGELGIRLATWNEGDPESKFADRWPILRGGPVHVVSEMPADEDYDREETVLASLGKQRSDLKGRYFRQNMNTAALGQQVLDSEEWRTNFIEWAQEIHPIVLIIDPSTSATDADAWGNELRKTFRHLRLIQEALPELVIILVVHLKKPSGRGNTTALRGLDAVMGEYGRLNDVTILMQDAGDGKTIMSARKRVRDQSRFRVTKKDGLLVDAQDIDTSPQPKVATDTVIATIMDNPGLSFSALGQKLGVSKSTVSKYVADLTDQAILRLETGQRGSKRVFLADDESDEDDE